MQLEYKKKHGIKSSLVFCSKVGTLIDERNMLTSFHSVIEKINEAGEAQIPKRGLHSLRKLFCKRMIDTVGVDWETLKDVMGHSNSAIAKNWYYSVNKSDVLDLSFKMNLETPEIRSMMTNEDSAFDADGY